MAAEPYVIESREPGEIDPRNGKPLSQSPAAIRARKMRAERKAGASSQPGVKTRTRRVGGKPRMPRAPKTLYPEISAFLMMANTVVTMTPLGSKYEPTGGVTLYDAGNGISIPMPEMRQTTIGDELDDLEIMHLAKSLDAQCQRSPRFKRYVEMVLGMAAGGGVATIVVMIAARRLARHGILPADLDPKLGGILAGDLSALASFVPSQPIDDTPDATSGERPPVPDGEDAFSYAEA